MQETVNGLIRWLLDKEMQVEERLNQGECTAVNFAKSDSIV